MSYLFVIEERSVYPNPETLLIEPFKSIWERDESPKKQIAIQEFSYVEFMISMLKSNPYRDYAEDMKDTKIRADIIRELDWQPDVLVKAAMEKLIEFQTEGSLTYSYWMANKKALENQIEFFLNVDVNERNFKTGNPIYKPKDIPDAVSAAEKVLTTINGLKSKVDEELFQTSKLRSNKVISPFANPDSLKD